MEEVHGIRPRPVITISSVPARSRRSRSPLARTARDSLPSIGSSPQLPFDVEVPKTPGRTPTPSPERMIPSASSPDHDETPEAPPTPYRCIPLDSAHQLPDPRRCWCSSLAAIREQAAYAERLRETVQHPGDVVKVKETFKLKTGERYSVKTTFQRK